jgi:hypothetical protein
MPVRMMLANDELRTVLVSIHVSLRQALEAVTREQVLQTLRITRSGAGRGAGAAAAHRRAGLNPHAGEGRPVRPGGDWTSSCRRCRRVPRRPGRARAVRARHRVHAGAPW